MSRSLSSKASRHNRKVCREISVVGIDVVKIMVVLVIKVDKLVYQGHRHHLCNPHHHSHHQDDQWTCLSTGSLEMEPWL
jgi:hypothetical protein